MYCASVTAVTGDKRTADGMGSCSSSVAAGDASTGEVVFSGCKSTDVGTRSDDSEPLFASVDNGNESAFQEANMSSAIIRNSEGSSMAED